MALIIDTPPRLYGNLGNEHIWMLRKWFRVDYETGLVYRNYRQKGQTLGKPIGCRDSNGYVKCQVFGLSCYAHQLVFAHFHGWLPYPVCDHVNQSRHDNSIRNLREATHSQNGLNAKQFSTNTSGVKGASITGYGNYKVTKAGKYLGTYQSAKEASDAYSRYNPVG